MPVELNADGSWVFPLTAAAKTGYQFMIGAETVRQWSAHKSRLKPFCRLTQDCDAGGAMIIDRLPTKAEAVIIRDILGIPKRIELSEGQLANLRAHAAANAFQPAQSHPGSQEAAQ